MYLKTLQFFIQYTHARNNDNVVNSAIQMTQINTEAFYEHPLQPTSTVKAQDYKITAYLRVQLFSKKRNRQESFLL